ncbi:hypothetical protein F5882DRAFT_373433 [Hyaloscypha sp. PMI_1271]|nr:hypothetical protein F5882DRAFT_373433 [Hyaloscypha sp. PMI_1271]
MARTAVTVLGMQVPERWEQRGNGALASRDTQKPVKCGADGWRARGRVAQASPTFPAQMSLKGRWPIPGVLFRRGSQGGVGAKEAQPSFFAKHLVHVRSGDRGRGRGRQGQQNQDPYCTCSVDGCAASGGSATTNDRSARRGKGATGDVVKHVLPESRSPMLAPPNSRHYYCVLLELRRGHCAEDAGYVARVRPCLRKTGLKERKKERKNETAKERKKCKMLDGGISPPQSDLFGERLNAKTIVASPRHLETEALGNGRQFQHTKHGPKSTFGWTPRNTKDETGETRCREKTPEKTPEKKA